MHLKTIGGFSATHARVLSLIGRVLAWDVRPIAIPKDVLLQETDCVIIGAGGGENSMVALRALRNVSDVPAIVLLSQRERAYAAVLLDRGADRCVVEDSSCRRLFVILRRYVESCVSYAEAARTPLPEAAVMLDPMTCELVCAGVRYRLNRHEYLLAQELLGKPGTVVPRAALNEIMYGEDDPRSNLVETYIHRMRRRFGPYRDAIETVPGCGYRFVGITEA